MGEDQGKEPKTITVSGVTFSADQVKSAVVTIGDRDVHIGEKVEDSSRQMGFLTEKDNA